MTGARPGKGVKLPEPVGVERPMPASCDGRADARPGLGPARLLRMGSDLSVARRESE